MNEKTTKERLAVLELKINILLVIVGGSIGVEIVPGFIYIIRLLLG